MAKQKFNIIKSTCIPIAIDNNNTDNIIYNNGSYEETFNIITELLNKFISNDIIK